MYFNLIRFYQIKSVSVSAINSNLRLLGIRCVSVIKRHVWRAWWVCAHSCCRFAYKLIDSSLSCFQRCSCSPSFSWENECTASPKLWFFLEICATEESQNQPSAALSMPLLQSLSQIKETQGKTAQTERSFFFWGVIYSKCSLKTITGVSVSVIKSKSWT